MTTLPASAGDPHVSKLVSHLAQLTSEDDPTMMDSAHLTSFCLAFSPGSHVSVLSCLCDRLRETLDPADPSPVALLRTTMVISKWLEFCSETVPQPNRAAWDDLTSLLIKTQTGSGAAGIAKAAADRMLVHPQELARQLTLIEHELFSRLTASEIVHYACGRSDARDHIAPNVAKITDHFNKVGRWVAWTIVSARSPGLRARRMRAMVKMGEDLLALNNFNAVKEVIAGIESPAVIRLSNNDPDVRAALEPTDYGVRLDGLSRIVGSGQNYRMYRMILAETVPPCILFLGCILADLTFLYAMPTAGPTSAKAKAQAAAATAAATAAVAATTSASASASASTSASASASAPACASAAPAAVPSEGVATAGDAAGSDDGCSISRELSTERAFRGGASLKHKASHAYITTEEGEVKLDLSTHLKIARGILFIAQCQEIKYALGAVPAVRKILTDQIDASAGFTDSALYDMSKSPLLATSYSGQKPAALVVGVTVHVQ
eukprot:g1608.t1